MAGYYAPQLPITVHIRTIITVSSPGYLRINRMCTCTTSSISRLISRLTVAFLGIEEYFYITSLYI